MSSAKDVLSMSKQDVTAWFLSAQDEGLRRIGQDLQDMWSGEVPASDVVSVLGKLSEIIDDDGNFKRGHTSKIALYVFGNKTKTGGAYNRKIQQVKQDIKRVVATLQGLSVAVPEEYVSVANTTTNGTS